MAQDRVLSGVITIATAGTAQRGTTGVSAWRPAIEGGGFFIRALAANTGLIYIGNDGAGDVASTNGYSLAAGSQIFVSANSLDELIFDSSVNGEKLCWLKA